MVAVVVGNEHGVTLDRDHELGEIAVADDPPELLLGDQHTIRALPGEVLTGGRIEDQADLLAAWVDRQFRCLAAALRP